METSPIASPIAAKSGAARNYKWRAKNREKFNEYMRACNRTARARRKAAEPKTAAELDWRKRRLAYVVRTLGRTAADAARMVEAEAQGQPWLAFHNTNRRPKP